MFYEFAIITYNDVTHKMVLKKLFSFVVLSPVIMNVNQKF